jgi:2-C-methyl-D-erythritol 4-phosphate cytidylyltransferase
MKNIAIILAGGIGSRVGGKTPKQLLPLEDGRTVLEHAVDAFEAAPAIEEIAIVMHPDYMDLPQTLCQKNKWQKVAKIIPGGIERWESSWHAILAYLDETSSPVTGNPSPVTLWFHDAARPFVSQRIIADVADALENHDAVTVAVPVTDTLYMVQRSNVQSTEMNVASVPSLSDFMRAQTPQAFHIDLIADAYMKAIAGEEIIATDDAGIVRKYEPRHPICIVPGEEANRKITYKGDL